MSISFACPHCAKLIKCQEPMAGKSAKCPGCGERLTVPMLLAQNSTPMPIDSNVTDEVGQDSEPQADLSGGSPSPISDTERERLIHRHRYVSFDICADVFAIVGKILIAIGVLTVLVGAMGMTKPSDEISNPVILLASGLSCGFWAVICFATSHGIRVAIDIAESARLTEESSRESARAIADLVKELRIGRIVSDSPDQSVTS